jgi:hypothetical protein
VRPRCNQPAQHNNNHNRERGVKQSENNTAHAMGLQPCVRQARADAR